MTTPISPQADRCHWLKTLPEYFAAVASGEKTFEIRKNDRGFRVGDELVLMEYQPGGGFSGREIDVEVSYLTDFEQKPGYVVMAIRKRTPETVPQPH